MNFRHLKYFVATAESGQVSRAATALSISQSAITTAIRDLETELGADLFLRSAHGMEMTDAGREFLASAQDILTRLDEAKNLSHRRSTAEGVISIAATYTVIGYFLPYHLDRLAHLYPGIEIRLSELNRESIEEGLLSNRFDMAVVLTSNLTNPEIETETLLRSTRRLWVPSNHPFHRAGKFAGETAGIAAVRQFDVIDRPAGVLQLCGEVAHRGKDQRDLLLVVPDIGCLVPHLHHQDDGIVLGPAPDRGKVAGKLIAQYGNEDRAGVVGTHAAPTRACGKGSPAICRQARFGSTPGSHFAHARR